MPTFRGTGRNGNKLPKWDYKEVQHWLVTYKRTKVMPLELVPIINGWIELQCVRHGSDLDREDTMQHLWLFVCSLLRRKLNTRRGNWHSWVLMCLRQEIIKIRTRHFRQPHAMGDCSQVGEDHRICEWDERGRPRQRHQDGPEIEDQSE